MGRKLIGRRAKIGAVVRELRRAQGYTQKDLARRIGVGRSTVAYWERTGHVSGLRLLPALTRELGLSLCGFLRRLFGADADKRPPPPRRTVHGKTKTPKTHRP